MTFEVPTEAHKHCVDLLEIIWRGIPAGYKRRYRREVWRQFQEEIEAATYTDNLAQFVSSLCARFGATIRTSLDAATLSEILGFGDDKLLLRLMRTETLRFVALLRVASQERREKWEAQQAEELEMEQAGFGLPEEEANR